MSYKKVFLLMVAIVVSLSFGAAYADPGPSPEHSSAYWEAAYWNNTSLSGEPVLRRSDTALDFDWANGSPSGEIQSDGFSARWQRYLDLSAGRYRFSATSDDGIRVYVDGSRVIDQWNDHAVQTHTADVDLTTGHHLVVVEFYENRGQAVAKLSWAPAPVTIVNWRGDYYANRDLAGSPVLTRDDAAIDFNWAAGSPHQSLPADGFSVLWTREIVFQPGQYRFTTTTDDGVRLWVNEHLLIDQWHEQAVASHDNTLFLNGTTTVKMAYYEHYGLAVARLSWQRIDGQPTPQPGPTGTVIVDDSSPGFVQGGRWTAWRTESEGHGGHLTWTWNNDKVRPSYNWARWYPHLGNSLYEVFVFVPERFTTTSQARYWVSHQGGYTLRIVDQSANGGRWVSLGTYHFRGTGSDYVSLSDVTYEPLVTRLIAFDAVKWVPR